MKHNPVSDIVDFLLQPAWVPQSIFAVHHYGRSLGFDAQIAERCQARRVFRYVADAFA
jgi:hypothetical protein